MDTELGFKHFYEFYGKVNVLSEITDKKKNSFTDITVFNIIFGDANKERPQESTGYTQTLTDVLNKQHDSNTLIESLIYKQEKPTTTEPDNIAKHLRIGSFAVSSSRYELTISSEVVAKPDPAWFDHRLVSIFNIDENAAHSNIADLHLITHNYSEPIKNLFTFHRYRVGNGMRDNDQYVWESKYNMLALLTQSFLLLTFDMYHYNKNDTPLFRSNFDIILPVDSKQKTKKITLSDLLSIETFSPSKLPTFLMLLIYYAGYSFNIHTHDITSKFRNKFNQSSNKTSFPIKLYVPIAHPNETKYNNKVTGAIKPETVDLLIETLQVYHVGIKIASLWDYVNGKLTILISNMLNSSDKTVKDSFKTLFKKTYNSNKLFLFECISELKKYKEYILNSSNIQSIEFPMSTLKTLEILILKLSYILSVLEPTFIPIETMSFDVTMNGKILKYVINSELQATNISIDDHISNDKLMEALLSTRALIIDTSDKGKLEASNFFSESTAFELQKSLIQKEVDTCTTNQLVKLIAYKKIERERTRSLANYDKIRVDKAKKETEEGLNTAIQHYKLELDFFKAMLEYNLAFEVLDAANKLFDAFKKNERPSAELFSNFRKPTNDITSVAITNTKTDIEKTASKLEEKKRQLKELKAKSPKDREKITEAARIEENTKIRDKQDADKLSRAQAKNSDVVQTKVVIKASHIDNDNQCGFRFGQFNTVINPDYKLGKIMNIERSTIGKTDKEELTIFDKDGSALIDKDFILLRIERHPYPPGSLTPVWKNDPNFILGANGDQFESHLRVTFKSDAAHKKAMTDFNRTYRGGRISSKRLQQLEEDILRLQYLLNTLNNLETNKMYTFTFKKPESQAISKADPGFGVGGGKNTTKKVYRKQRQRQGQTHSKTKKVFES